MRSYRILFLCTGNSARSQMAEALITQKAPGRFQAASAGSKPAPRVHPLTIEALRQAGIEWSGKEPKGIDAVAEDRWDFVITVCDRAKEACPVLPGRPVMAHWGMEDPGEVERSGGDELRAFVLARQLLARRIDLLLALPLEKLDRLSLGARLADIGRAAQGPEGARRPDGATSSRHLE